jgi:hypothetical protein
MEELTRLEERIMQCIWDYQGEVPFLDLIETVKEKLNKDYKRTSIRGYLFRLEEKGYIKVTKKGRKAYGKNSHGKGPGRNRPLFAGDEAGGAGVHLRPDPAGPGDGRRRGGRYHSAGKAGA